MKIAVLPNVYDIHDQASIEGHGEFIRESILLHLSQFKQHSTIDALWTNNDDRPPLETDLALRFSFHPLGEAVIIRCKAVNPKTGEVNWFEEIRNDSEDWQQVNVKLLSIVGENLNLVTQTKSVNQDAYKAVIEAKYHYNKFNPADGKIALSKFRKAVQLEPAYPEAYGGLAKTYFYLANWVIVDPIPAFKQAILNAKKALEFAPNYADALVVLGHTQMYFEKDFVAAEKSFNQALTFGTISANVLEKYAWFLCCLHKFDEALETMEKASQLDPSNLFVKHFIGDIYRYLGEFDLSTIAYQEVLNQEPLFRHSIEYIGLNYLTKKDPNGARPYIFKYKSLVPDPEKGMLPLLFYYAEKGLWNEVSQIEELFERQLKKDGPRLHVNLLNAALIRKDYKSAEKHFTKLWELGIALTSLLCDVLFEGLRNQPYFKKALLEVKMPSSKHDVFIEQRNRPLVKLGKGNDQLSLKPNNFFYAKAEGNYLEIHYFDFHSLNRHLVRTTFKDLLHAFNNEDIVQCHRGFVVNLKFGFELKGNSKQRELYYKEYDISIPLSRSFKV